MVHRKDKNLTIMLACKAVKGLQDANPELTFKGQNMTQTDELVAKAFA